MRGEGYGMEGLGDGGKGRSQDGVGGVEEEVAG